MKQEKDIVNDILLRATARGHRLFRQNVGNGWVGKTRAGRAPGRMTIDDARPLIAGLCVGSSDIVGWSATGTFVAFEVKTPGVYATPAQKAFIAAAQSCGCIAAVVYSADEAMALLP